jgi:hypothetical protein
MQKSRNQPVAVAQDVFTAINARVERMCLIHITGEPNFGADMPTL